eukprot:6460230-Prymnesium_polylepis.1
MRSRVAVASAWRVEASAPRRADAPSMQTPAAKKMHACAVAHPQTSMERRQSRPRAVGAPSAQKAGGGAHASERSIGMAQRAAMERSSTRGSSSCHSLGRKKSVRYESVVVV